MNISKRSYIVIAAVVVLGLVLLLSTKDAGSDLLVGDTLFVTTFLSGGEPTGTVLLQVPFLESRDSTSRISVLVDSNGDGTFTVDEQYVSDVPVQPQANWRTGYYAAGAAIASGNAVRIVIDGTEYSATAEVAEHEVGTLLDLASVTDPENATKGWGTSYVYAQEVVEVTQDNVPDISQQPGECAPTTAANSLISLIDKHGKPADLPGTPGDIIDELKTDMKWTRANGVVPDDFVAGKNAWAKRHGLPITTKKIGDAHGAETVDDIREALEDGGAVELRIKFADASGTKVVGGHMVTVTGIHQGEGQTYLDINDPATPEGTETVEVQGNQMTNYGPYEGITVLSWAFVQKWEIAGATDTSSTSMSEEPVAVEMAYNHTKPGEYSEVYAVVMTTPGNEVTAKLTGPAVDFKGTQHVIADENGQARFVWKIYQYGEYTVTGAVESGAQFTGSVQVQ